MKAGERMEKQMLMIVNPRSGKKRYSDDLLEVTNIFNRHGYNITVMNTTGSGDATRFAREFGGKYDTVVCRGGDGTFCETLNGLMALEKRPEIGFIPAGTTLPTPSVCRPTPSRRRSSSSAPRRSPTISGFSARGTLHMWRPSALSPPAPTRRIRN